MQEMQEMGVWSLGGEDPPEKGMATHSSILAWRISWTGEPGGYSSWGFKESAMTEHIHTTNARLSRYTCSRLLYENPENFTAGDLSTAIPS